MWTLPFFQDLKVFATPSEGSFDRKGYGLIVAVRESTFIGAQLWAKTYSSLWVCLRFVGDLHPPIYIGNVYVPPLGSPLLSTYDLDMRFGELSGVLQALQEDHNYVLVGGDFNGHVALTSTSSSPEQGIHCGQNRIGRYLVNWAVHNKVRICTGKVLGDLRFPATFRATQRTSATRPDHILASNILFPTLQSIEVQSHLRGSDHFAIVTKMSIAISGPIPREREGTSLRAVKGIYWQRAHKIPYVEKLEEAALTLTTCI